ncbi:hypothetical protein PPERSA_03544 [Pseudocohnilembus persalinus]|uniref:Uncharacterized protein n=1 Tax=Pseudocohnilembus persalinus TaxID=266149 RepID=A0A0V0QQK9_PSEPJ|nr:hypothetical protein PPERSA_03544 [Pseudocohnilembus persalinus]|eukprot:KRX04304.1 hypothetical protein PPERSA_03544 [Pseudocohnilembus persalinus]
MNYIIIIKNQCEINLQMMKMIKKKYKYKIYYFFFTFEPYFISFGILGKFVDGIGCGDEDRFEAYFLFGDLDGCFLTVVLGFLVLVFVFGGIELVFGGLFGNFVGFFGTGFGFRAT